MRSLMICGKRVWYQTYLGANTLYGEHVFVFLSKGCLSPRKAHDTEGHRGGFARLLKAAALPHKTLVAERPALTFNAAVTDTQLEKWRGRLRVNCYFGFAPLNTSSALSQRRWANRKISGRRPKGWLTVGIEDFDPPKSQQSAASASSTSRNCSKSHPSGSNVDLSSCSSHVLELCRTMTTG